MTQTKNDDVISSLDGDTEVYDEVIPCVYDDVDTKYDVMDFTNEPPAPPIRKRLPSTHIGEYRKSTNTDQAV